MRMEGALREMRRTRGGITKELDRHRLRGIGVMRARGFDDDPDRRMRALLSNPRA
jgi:hypothetical protein